MGELGRRQAVHHAQGAGRLLQVGALAAQLVGQDTARCVQPAGAGVEQAAPHPPARRVRKQREDVARLPGQPPRPPQRGKEHLPQRRVAAEIGHPGQLDQRVFQEVPGIHEAVGGTRGVVVGDVVPVRPAE